MSRHLFIDMNSFFASVEQQERPELRGKPVIVVPMDVDSTCAIAASYEAKAFGVKTLTGVGEAKRKCAGLQVVQARPELYQQYHQRIVEVLNRHFVDVKVQSVDEMACLIGRWHAGTTGEIRPIGHLGRIGWLNKGEAEKAAASRAHSKEVLQREAEARLAGRVKEDLYAQVGECMKCSIGIADNVFLAKVATEMEKPDGLTILDESNMPQALFKLGLRDFPGIGPSMHDRLLRAGITTVEQMWGCSREELRRLWGGIGGDRWWHMLRGSREVDYEAGLREDRKSVGHSHVLPPDFRSLAGARGILMRLVSRALKRLRAYGLVGRDVHLQVSFMRGALSTTEATENGGSRKAAKMQRTATAYPQISQISQIGDLAMGGALPAGAGDSWIGNVKSRSLRQAQGRLLQDDPVLQHNGAGVRRGTFSQESLMRCAATVEKAVRLKPNTQYPIPSTRKSSWSSHCSVAIHANDDLTWMGCVRRALDSLEIPEGYFPLKVAATFTDLISCDNANLSLFDDRAKRARLFETVDALNERFGHVVDLASVYWLREEAPYRIAFGASLLDAVR